jgi:serine protease AprX
MQVRRETVGTNPRGKRRTTRRGMLLALVGGLATMLATGAVALGSSSSTAGGVGLSRLDASFDPRALVRGIATFDATPTAARVAALKAFGLTVQPMKHLPLALVRGPVASIDAAVNAGAASDVYPDERLQYFDMSSADAMGAAIPRTNGYTGKGVTVAVVDSGCDASHPDLADHVVHNVKLYSAEYANVAPDSSNTIVVPVELGPYQNSDLGSGHGTHVAGIIAADGHTSPDHIGVAPDANLVCYSVGEVIFTTAVVTAYDNLLDQPNLWGVKVINNSWGNSFQQFDPRSPVAVATRAVADLGVNVIFAAGNSGGEEVEMGLNPFSEAPWVTSVAAENLQHVRASFSSNGLLYDNSQPVTIGAGGHTVFTGDRIGVYHPDLTAPGDEISSTCDSAGTVVGPCPPGSNATASGTSMASPHAAGAAAVLVQANPNLTPDQVRSALEVTAAPVTKADGSRAPFWEVGYGRIDLAASVDLVRDKAAVKNLQKTQSSKDTNVLRGIPFKVPTSDFWTWDAPRATVLGTPDTRTFTANVPSTTTQLKVALSHPSLTALDLNGTEYSVTVSDAAGKALGTTTESFTAGAGTATLQVDLKAAKATPGAFTFAVSGDLAASDPDTLDSESALGRVVVLQVAQLQPR